MRRAGLLLWAALSSCGTAKEAGEARPGPELRPLIDALGDDDIDVRERAAAAIAALGDSVLPAVERAIAQTTDVEVAARLRQIRGRLLGVTAELKFETPLIRDGEGFRWRAFLVNGKTEAVLLVRPLQGSTTYRQLPFVDIEVEMPDGRVISGTRFQYERSGHVNPPGPEDMIRLAPGANAELFADVTVTEHKIPWFDSWAPPAGRYRARFVYDSSPTHPWIWMLDEPRRHQGEPLLTPETLGVAPGRWDWVTLIAFDRVHHARIVSDWVELTVE